MADHGQLWDILKDETWRAFPLDMTCEGLVRFAAVAKGASKEPTVYVHVETATGRVLRIGKAERGLYARWCQASNGHVATFEWAMGWSNRYKRYAAQFPNYVLFFRRIAHRPTTVWALVCEATPASRVERLLISGLGPVWEPFAKACRAVGIGRSGHALNDAVCSGDFSDPTLPDIDHMQSLHSWPLNDRSS
jgi:hypothetical protein